MGSWAAMIAKLLLQLALQQTNRLRPLLPSVLFIIYATSLIYSVLRDGTLGKQLKQQHGSPVTSFITTVGCCTTRSSTMLRWLYTVPHRTAYRMWSFGRQLCLPLLNSSNPVRSRNKRPLLFLPLAIENRARSMQSKREPYKNVCGFVSVLCGLTATFWLRLTGGHTPRKIIRKTGIGLPIGTSPNRSKYCLSDIAETCRRISLRKRVWCFQFEELQCI